MGGMSLLRRARLAGLDVWTQDGGVFIEGPEDQEALALEVIAHKAEVVEALAREQAGPWPKETVAITADIFGVVNMADLMALGTTDRPPGTCYACGGGAWWRLRRAKLWICTRCYPPSPPREETETWDGDTGSGR